MKDEDRLQLEDITLDDIVRYEVTRLIMTSKKYKENIDTAKTSAKKKYFEKKLKKNNEEILELLATAELSARIKQDKKNENDISNPSIQTSL